MTAPAPQPTPQAGESEPERLERERLEQRRAEDLISQVPPSPPTTRLPQPSAVYTGNSPDEVAARLIGAFEQHLKLVVANTQQMSDMWGRAWEQIRVTLDLMEATAKIMQVVIGEAAATQESLSDAVNRVGVVATSLAQTNIQMQAFLQTVQEQQGGA